jgi:hypothetical protein
MLSFFTPLYAATDIKTTDWFYDSVNRLIEDDRAIIVGYPDGSFRPQNKLTRDQFITMVVRAAGQEPGNAEGYWAQNYIDTAIELGFLETSDFTDYTGQITREEMSMIIMRAVEHLEGQQALNDLEQVLQVVSDSDDFTYKYKNYIMQTYKLGIITGYTDDTFRPQGVLSRAEASAVLVRLIDSKERIEFDFDALYEKQHSGIESKLLGGANWVDPLTASDYESAKADWDLMTSDMDYLPRGLDFELNIVGTQQSIDTVMGAFEYDENGPIAGHLEDFERLLQRRMSQNQVDIVMNYMEKKTDKYTYLEHDQAFFYLDDDKYLVRIDEVKLYDSYDKVKAAIEVNFNIWYRDANFINKYEEDITQIMPYTDVVIYR